MATVADATAAAIRDTGIEARLILCTLRHFSPEQSMETARLTKQFFGNIVAGFDIAADEAGFPLDAHLDAFRYARAAGLFITAHAGEACGPESVWETLEKLKPSRIGHGVRSVEDPGLVEHLKREKIHLEVCPSCNVQIDIYPGLSDHPVDRLYRAGISVGINTDARTIVNVTLTDEYERLHRVFGWTARDFLCCNQNAIRAAFIPVPLKEKLISELNNAYQAY